MNEPRPHYSGGLSRKFWTRINTYSRISGAWDDAYQLGCLLQNIESFVLKRLEQLQSLTKKK